MTYIPNVRERKDQLSAMYGKDRDNAYFEGYLNDHDRLEVSGFDWAVRCLECALDYAGVKEKKAQKVLGYMESDRNEMVVSMLDNMDTEEYERIKAKVDAEVA